MDIRQPWGLFYLIHKVPGVLEYKTEYKDGSSHIKFDNSKTSEQNIVNALNETGYKVIKTQK